MSANLWCNSVCLCEGYWQRSLPEQFISLNNRTFMEILWPEINGSQSIWSMSVGLCFHMSCGPNFVPLCAFARARAKETFLLVLSSLSPCAPEQGLRSASTVAAPDRCPARSLSRTSPGARALGVLLPGNICHDVAMALSEDHGFMS